MSADRGRAPSRIGRFEIRREIGRGTMGVVYEAHDPVLGRTVAVKTIALTGAPPERAAFEQRFLAEARIAARLSHPGLVVIHDAGRDAASGTLYMALEHLSGRTLEELIAEGRPVEWHKALRILGRIAAALHHAHDQGVVHRDVKPANVMLLDSGETKIMDFGIAKLVVEGNATVTGQLLGTPLYMAPEQALAEPVDARTDIFSLGAIAYSLLTGKRAFQASSIATILARVLHHHPPPPSSVVKGLPAAVDELVARAMAKSPADRYPTARAFGEDVDDLLADRPPRHRAGWTPPPMGVGTLVSSGAEGGDLEDLELIQGPPAAPVRRRMRSDPRPRFLAMILLGGGIGIAAAGLLRFEVLAPDDLGRPASSWLASRSPETGEASPSALPADAGDVAPDTIPETAETPAAEPLPSAETPTGPSPEPPLPVAISPEVGAAAVGSSPPPEGASPAPPPEPVPAAEGPASPDPAVASPSPLPSAPARPTEAGERTPDPKEKARLAIHLDPTLQARSLRLWVDGKLLADQKLDPGAARKTQTLRADLPLKVVSLSPGRRQVRVQVRTEEGLRSERLIVTFKAGAARRLDVKAGRASTALSFVLR